MTLIEAKASGIPLTAELRRMGIPVVNFTPSKGNDKHARVNSVSPLLNLAKFGPRCMNILPKKLWKSVQRSVWRTR